MRTGGWADKLGNRYEGRWTAKQLLRLLAEKLHSVQLETEDAIEQRVDLIVRRADGTTEAQQCKKNNSKNNWTMNELARRGVLTGLRNLLITAPTHRFSFISNREPTDLKRLIEKARGASGDLEAFRARLDGGEHSSWERLCAELRLSPAAQPALELLARADVVVFDDGPTGQEDLDTLASLLLDGDPRGAALRLADFALEHMGEPIHVDELRRFLHEQTGFRVRDLVYSPGIATGIEACQAEFSQSIHRTLIQGKLLPRPETVELHSAITAGKGTRIHCVDGGGGQGKSCILHELAQMLARDGLPFLPLRFDVYPPRGNSRSYGQLLDLPDSPVRCLHAVAGDRRGVLLIDQLDALRWSPQHDPSAWAVFERLVAEALQLSETMHIVVACRSFDLEADPQIRPWREQERIRSLLDRIHVGDFPGQYVEDVVKGAGGSWQALTAGQRRLLERPQSLYLWTKLPSDARSAFRTATDLMRTFWLDVRRRLVQMGLTRGDVEGALGALVSRLDQDGASTAPATVLDRWPTVRDALASLGVIEEVHGYRLRFAHQGYFDYSLAEFWLARLQQEGGTITTWLSAMDEQSLLRRGQLRQLLAVLQDDDPTRFLNAIRDLLHTSGIRFHLKHLALQFLGSLPEPTPAEVRYAEELLHEEELRPAVSSQVLYQHAQWFDAFDAQGIWATWLSSDEEWKADIAASMLGHISTQRGDRTAQLLLPYADRPAPWPERVRRMLPWNADEDTRALFQLRLQLLGNGVRIHPAGLFSDKLARREPTWLIVLLAHLLARADQGNRDEGQDTLARGEFSPYWPAYHIASTVENIAEAAPACFWQTIAPFVVSAVAQHRAEPPRWDRRVFAADGLWQQELWRHEHTGGKPLPALLALAGGRWAQIDAGALLAAIAPIANNPSRTIQQLVGTVWLHGPDCLADHALGWLIEDDRRFCLGHLGTESERRLARDLIVRYAPLCTDAVYPRLESALMHGDPAGEQEDFKNMLRGGLPGPSRIGFLRHALLPALPQSRRSACVTNALGQLQAKFRHPAEEIDPQPATRGGFVTSPIAPRAVRLRDGAWLRLITSPQARSRYYNRRFTRAHVVESSPEMFARDLGRQAGLEPVRFAKLALRMSPCAPLLYWTGLLHSLALTTPPDQATEGWRPATDAQCCDVLRRLGFPQDRDVAMAVARCVRARHDYHWPDDIVATTCRIASEHTDPERDHAVIAGDVDHRLDSEAISTARGCAADALAALLFQRGVLSPAARAAIEHLVGDPVPGIRVAALGTLLPVLNIDRDQAVSWFLRACAGTLDEVLASQNAQRFMSYAISTHTREFNHILDRMRRSSRPAVAEAGAQWTTVVWLYDGGRETCFRECADGSVAQRKGVASVLAGHVHDERVAGKCQAWLPRFLDDSENDVRVAACGFLRTAPSSTTGKPAGLLRAFVASAAFRSQPDQLVWELQGYNGDLRPLAQLIFEACDRLTPERAESGEQEADRVDVLGQLSVFLLRLYGQLEPPNDDPELRRKCLDRWDRLLRHCNYIPTDVAAFLE
jgi:hypothetical protein